MVSIFPLQKISAVQIEILRSFKFYGKRIGAWPSPFLGRPDSTITLGKIISLNYTSTSIDSAKDKVGVMHLSKNSFRIWVQQLFEGKIYFHTKDWFEEIFRHFSDKHKAFFAYFFLQIRHFSNMSPLEVPMYQTIIPNVREITLGYFGSFTPSSSLYVFSY